MPVFKMAYMLKIDPRTLLNYESGREKIPGELWEKICNALHLKLEELFPAFVTYDNGNTYSLMHPFDLKWTFNLLIDEINIDGYTLGHIRSLYIFPERRIIPDRFYMANTLEKIFRQWRSNQYSSD